MYTIGIDIGYSAVKISLVNFNKEIVFNEYRFHKGKFKNSLEDILKKVFRKYNSDQIIFGALSGSIGRSISGVTGLQFVQEVPALVEGSLMLKKDIRGIVEIGGQSSKYIIDFNREDKSGLRVSMNSNCSAGTGSFLEEQLSRLDLQLEDYSKLSEKAKIIPRIAGRCSVFAKTDIIHHQQEGVPVNDILKGLAYAVTKNFCGSVMKKLPKRFPLIFTGGVAKNRAVVNSLRDVLGLTEDEIFVPQNCGNVLSAGVALIAYEKKIKLDIFQLMKYIGDDKKNIFNESAGHNLDELCSYGENDHSNKHNCSNNYKSTKYYLGIDTGSTSTNVVLIDENNDIVSYRYLKTQGDPKAALKKALVSIYNESGGDIKICGVCTTGSGRYMIGDFIGADIVKDEITAQAKATAVINRDVDTIFEIGGQDSKYISLENGIVKDFQMNKICAAGTGSFIEEQAAKFNIPVSEFGRVALLSKNPISLGERCTVFIESSVAEHLSAGADIRDICAGLCYSVVKNYLDRVVGQKKIGENIFLQGGLGFNQGVVNAFRSLTGKKITVPPFFSVTGAYGAAVMAMEEIENEETAFKGFYPEDEIFEELSENRESQVTENSIFAGRIDDLIFKGYDPKVDPAKKTVGIPRALFTFGMFQMFYNFFRELDLNVILSDPTDEKTIALAQQYSQGETCYPVKLVNGHVADLIEKQVDYIFFPDLYTVDHPGSNTRQNYGCAYMQLAFKIVKQTMDLENKGIELLAPTFAFSLGQEFMMKSFSGLGKILGKRDEEVFSALQKGMQAFKIFEERLGQNSQAAMKSLKPDETVFVMISKIYGVADPVLNMGIPQILEEMGYRVLPFYEIPETDISADHPNMFWPFGQHILEAAAFVKNSPNLYPIFLTHHGCGPDSVLIHYCREIMKDKPFLCLEVDEHSSNVGVRTRIEAFINSLKAVKISAIGNRVYDNYKTKQNETVTNYDFMNDEDNYPLYIPNIYPFSQIYREILNKRGINAKVMMPSSAESVSEGRKLMICEEYFSLSALLGDVCRCAEKVSENSEFKILIPQTEGAEVEGQYSRLIKTMLDEKGSADIKIISPFMEDFFQKDESYIQSVFLGIIAGDVILHSHPNYREGYLESILESIRNDCFNIESIKETANKIAVESLSSDNKKNILAVGEVYILYNDYLNDSIFNELENNDCRVLYSPLSEYFWFYLRDYIVQNKEDDLNYIQLLEKIKNTISEISCCMNGFSSFDSNLDRLVGRADDIVGYYAGANGRYRLAKTVYNSVPVEGVVNVMSMYENTGITLEILQKNLKAQSPVLNLTFDGNKNETDKTKIESFIYYL